MAQEIRIRSWLIFLSLQVLIFSQSCQKDPFLSGKKHILKTSTENSSASIDFPRSATGSIQLTIRCQKNTAGTISLSGKDDKDSSIMVFNYPFNMLRSEYPVKMVPETTQTLKLEWRLANARLNVFLGPELQTIRLAKNGRVRAVDMIIIQNGSNHTDGTDLEITFTGSELAEDIMTENRTRIVAFGNSTTAYRPTISGVYAQRLPDLLYSAGIANVVFNEGIPGSHTGYLSDNKLHKVRHGLDRFDESVLAREPDVVIICFGLNDSWVDKGKTEPRIPADAFQANLTQMITELEQRNIITILMTPNAIGSKYEQWRYDLTSGYAEIIRDLAEMQNLPLVDQWRLFEEYDRTPGKDIDDLLLDGMHPNDDWHEKVAIFLKDIIVEYINLKSA